MIVGVYQCPTNPSPRSILTKMINKDQIFPFKRYASDNGHFVSNPKLAEMIWQRVRPKGLTWYALDIELVSEDEATITVHSMRDSFHGGIGEVIHRQAVKIDDGEERRLADEYILYRCTVLAQEELERRDQEEYRRRVENARREMFGV
jgi:hypothetical protein